MIYLIRIGHCHRLEARWSDCGSQSDKCQEEAAPGGKGLFCLTVWKDTVTYGGKGMAAGGHVVTEAWAAACSYFYKKDRK